jgi:hypothetical protein
MRVLRALLIALAGFTLSAHAAEQERPQVARYAKVYRGPEGLIVSLLGVGAPDGNKFLLQYTGINHDWDMKIFEVEKVPSGTGHNYKMTIDGREYHTFVERPGWGGASNYEVYIPKLADGMNVVYDEGYSQRVVLEHYLTDYLQQGDGKAAGPAWR